MFYSLSQLFFKNFTRVNIMKNRILNSHFNDFLYVFNRSK